jgi:hypothetical protein
MRIGRGVDSSGIASASSACSMRRGDVVFAFDDEDLR